MMEQAGVGHVTRTALVTGASRGIGRGIALSLARQGFGLTVTSRTTGDLERLADELGAAGAAQVVHLRADMTDREALAELVQLHDRTYGSMNVLVLNAGTGTSGPVADYDLRRLDKTFEVNLVSAFVLARHAIPLLRRGARADSSRGATIVGVSSIAGEYAEQGLSVYGASKAALTSMLETINLEESRNGITAAAIAPGYVATDMSVWTADVIPVDTMIPVADVVAVVDMLVALSRQTSIPNIVMTRALSSGYQA